jgi:large subunit ribosomal protein L1
MEIQKALEELRKEKKRKFVQTVELIVNLQNFDVRKEALNTFVKIPNPSEKKICGFLTKKTKLVDSITKEEFDKYKEIKDVKKLANNYDFFIAAAPLMGLIATKFGRVFGPLNKMPSPLAGIMPIDNDEAIKAMVEKMKGLARVRTKDLSLKISIGKEDMADDKIIENVESVLHELEGKLPKKKENIKNAMIKFTMTPAVKI